MYARTPASFPEIFFESAILVMILHHVINR